MRWPLRRFFRRPVRISLLFDDVLHELYRVADAISRCLVYRYVFANLKRRLERDGSGVFDDERSIESART
jgi:hypothetical protein